MKNLLLRLAFLLSRVLPLLLAACGAWQHDYDAQAYMRGPDNKGIQGTLNIKRQKDGARVRGEIAGLNPGYYALFLNPLGICSRPGAFDGRASVHRLDGSAVETDSTWQKPLLVFSPDPEGVARIDFLTRILQLAPGDSDIMGRSLEVRKPLYEKEKPDSSLASRDFAERIACGVVAP